MTQHPLADAPSILEQARLEGFRQGVGQMGQVRTDEIEDIRREADHTARKAWRGYWQIMMAVSFFFGVLIGGFFHG